MDPISKLSKRWQCSEEGCGAEAVYVATMARSNRTRGAVRRRYCKGHGSPHMKGLDAPDTPLGWKSSAERANLHFILGILKLRVDDLTIVGRNTTNSDFGRKSRGDIVFVGEHAVVVLEIDERSHDLYDGPQQLRRAQDLAIYWCRLTGLPTRILCANVDEFEHRGRRGMHVSSQYRLHRIAAAVVEALESEHLDTDFELTDGVVMSWTTLFYDDAMPIPLNFLAQQDAVKRCRFGDEGSKAQDLMTLLEHVKGLGEIEDVQQVFDFMNPAVRGADITECSDFVKELIPDWVRPYVSTSAEARASRRFATFPRSETQQAPPVYPPGSAAAQIVARRTKELGLDDRDEFDE